MGFSFSFSFDVSRCPVACDGQMCLIDLRAVALMFLVHMKPKDLICTDVCLMGEKRYN